MTTREKVLEETKRFHDALPQLVQKYAGRWVVFAEGAVVSDHANENDAYKAALERFGVQGGFVVAPVVELKPTPITAGVLFGLQ